MNLYQILFVQTWAWWAGGLGLGLTAVALAWIAGKKLGVSGCLAEACSLGLGKNKEKSSSWPLWFLVGLPLGGLLANAGHWNWTWLYGQMDALSLGNVYFKGIFLFIGGALVGFGARWAGGCTSGHSILGIARDNKMSILATVAFLVAGIVTAHFLYQVL